MWHAFVMKQNKISILSTRHLNEDWINNAGELNIDLDINAFIETEPIQTVEVIEEIQNAFLRSSVVIFTSVNAVQAVGEILELQKPDWTIYCIGQATKQQVIKYFGESLVAGIADNAADLATGIIEDINSGKLDPIEIIFFCGKQRREELPQLLREQDIEINEIAVYETIATPHKLNKEYSGIMFFSPSGVESFFKNNKPDQHTLLFAIGNTTANAIRKFTDRNIIVSEEPSKDGMFQKLKETYGK